MSVSPKNEADEESLEDNSLNPLSDSIKKKLLDFNRRAEQAYQKQNFQYAAELYLHAYQLDRERFSDHLNKMVLSSVAAKNLASNPKLVSFQAFLANIPLYLKAMRTKYSEDSKEEFFDIYENILRGNPDSTFAIQKLAEIYEKINLKKNAAIVLEAFMRSHKNHIQTLGKIGTLYQEISEFDKARDAFKRITDIKPYDQFAEKKLKDIMAQTSIDESKLKGSSFRDLVKDKDATRKEQVEARLHKDDSDLEYLIREKLMDIEKTPGNLSLQYDLLKLYKEQGALQKIVDTLSFIYSQNTGDLNLAMELLDAEVNLFASMYSGDEKSKNREIQKKKKDAFESLLKQFPTSGDIKFYLAEVKMNVGELDDALKLFQDTAEVSDYAIPSILNKGKILMQKKYHDMALNEFKHGVDQIKEMNDQKKEMFYQMGLAYEALGSKDKALEQYKIIFKSDVGFLDVTQKIKDAYQEDEPA